MRKFLAASVVCLLAFAGQAMASDGGGGFSLPFCGPSAVPSDRAPAHEAARRAAGSMDSCTITSLVAVAGVIAVVALAVSNNDNSKSA